MEQITPEEFAHGAQQALGKAPTQPVKTTQPQSKDTFAEMVRQTDQAWPPPRGPSRYELVATERPSER